tara:strand:+ start:420 stop:1376 length:957 start_codon:yes stop_codon:yes gene_type:complete
MQFFYQDHQQDKIYLQAAATINLSFWISSDVNNYASDNISEINQYEYDRLISQYHLALNIFKDGEELCKRLKGDHAKCANLLLGHTFTSIKDDSISELFRSEELQDSELELNLLDAIFDADIFIKKYQKFLIPGDLETDLIKAEVIFANSSSKILNFINNQYTNFDDAAKDCEEIIDGIMSARVIVENAIKHNMYKRSLKREYSIFCDNNLVNPSHSFEDFYEASIKAIYFWREYYAIHEQFYKNFFDKADDSNNEQNFFHQTLNQYNLIMHKNSIELNTMILDNLDVTIPNFEIYSARKITNPIEFLQYKVQSRISR